MVWVVLSTADSRSAWAWVLAMLFCPPIATISFWLCYESVGESSPVERRGDYSRLQNLLYNECGARLCRHNILTPLHNADRTFASLIRDLHRARCEINVEYYILAADSIGRAIISILCRRARAGVRVRLLYDAYGSRHLDRNTLRTLSRSGVEVRAFRPLRFPLFHPLAHRRNHRKMVIIDHSVAYLGGINIAARYVDGGNQGFWRDEHIRLQGSATYPLQCLFADDWVKAGGVRIDTPKPKQRVRAALPIQIIHSEMGPTRQAITRTIIKAVMSAERSVRIATPYFLPPMELMEAICVAARSGVDVELMVPMVADVRLAELAAEGYLSRCVQQGVKVYRYRSGFLHSKVVVVDDEIVIVGSANIDGRSLNYNMEVVAVIYSRSVARDYISHFNSDRLLSERISLSEVAVVGLRQRIVQGFARLLAPLL